MPSVKEKLTDCVWIRVEHVKKLILKNLELLKNKNTHVLTEHVVAEYEVSERTAHRYIAAAKSEIRKLLRAKNEAIFNRAILDREYIIAEAKGSGDIRAALEAMKDRDKLYGLYVDEIKHTGEIAVRNIDFAKLTDEQLSVVERKIKNKEDVNEYLRSLGL